MKRVVTGIIATLMVLPVMFSAFAAAPALSIQTTPQAVKERKAAVRKEAAASSKYTLTVMNPQGPVKKARELAPRLGTLEGKKIALWLSATPDQLYAGKGTELFDMLGNMLREKFANIKIVSSADLPRKFAPENEIVEAIAATRPDAVVAGFGG